MLIRRCSKTEGAVDMRNRPSALGELSRAIARIVVALCAWGLALPAPALAQGATFAQLDGDAGCLLQAALFTGDDRPDECGITHALVSPTAVALGVDEHQVYVVGGGSATAGTNGVAVFAREPTSGALTLTSCVTDNGGDGRIGSEGICADADALAGASAIAFSPDGRFAYVSSRTASAISWFARDPNSGALTQLGCIRQIVFAGERCQTGRALAGASSVALSPDGSRAYVAAARSSAISVYDRNADTGALTAQTCVSETGTDGACTRVPGLVGADHLAMTPDGADLYVTGSGSLSSLRVDRASGDLAPGGCLLADAPNGGACEPAPLLVDVAAVAVTTDGRDVLAAANDFNSDLTRSFLIDYRRDPSTGRLSQGQCLQQVDAQGDDATDNADSGPPDLESGCESAKAISGVSGVAVSQDGRAVFTVADGSLAAFQRDSGSGTLTQFACGENAGYETYRSCTGVRGLSGSSALAASMDARNLYVTSTEDALTSFAATASVSAGARAAVGRTGTIRLRVGCPRAHVGSCGGAVVASGGKSRNFRLRAGQATVMRLPLGRRAMMRLRSRRPTHLNLTVTDARQMVVPVHMRFRVRARFGQP